MQKPLRGMLGINKLKKHIFNEITDSQIDRNVSIFHISEIYFQEKKCN